MASLTLSWGVASGGYGTVSSYLYAYKQTTDTTYITGITVNTTITINGLNDGVIYEGYVQSLCPNNDCSGDQIFWSQNSPTSTPTPTPTPTLTSTPIPTPTPTPTNTPIGLYPYGGFAIRGSNSFDYACRNVGAAIDYVYSLDPNFGNSVGLQDGYTYYNYDGSIFTGGTSFTCWADDISCTFGSIDYTGTYTIHGTCPICA